MNDETLRNTAAMVMAQGALIEHLLAYHMAVLPPGDLETYAAKLGAVLDTLGPAMKLPDGEAEVLADVTVRAQGHLRLTVARALMAVHGPQADAAKASPAGGR